MDRAGNEVHVRDQQEKKWEQYNFYNTDRSKEFNELKVLLCSSKLFARKNSKETEYFPRLLSLLT